MVSVVPCLAQTGNDLLHKCTDALRTIDNGERRTGDDQAVANAGWCSGYLNGLLYSYHAGILDENRALGLSLPSRLYPTARPHRQEVWRLRLEESRARDTSIHALDPQLTHLDSTHNLHGIYLRLKG
jgi:hypothetical protein